MTALIVIGINKFAETVFHVEKPKQSAYKVEGVEITETASSKTEVKEVVHLTIK